ncbi:acyl-CoA dehydrogenase family protein [Rhodococcus koreensis]
MTTIDDRPDQTELQQLTDLVAQIATDASTEVDSTGRAPLDRGVWGGLVEAGLTELSADDDGGWAILAVVLRELGRHAARVPFVEHTVLASWLCAAAGLSLEHGILTAGRMAGANSVEIPWGREVDTIVVIKDSVDGATARVVAVSRSQLVLDEATNLAAEPRGRVTGQLADPGVPVAAQLGTQFLLRGALARSVMIAGAAQRVVDLVTEHVTTREQFGRPLAKFQAIQNLVADIASESALIDATTAAAIAAADEYGLDHPQAVFAISCAASCTGHAASTIVRNAHQALGAMGYTQEHSLHRYTNRILSWRTEFGSVRRWDSAVARMAQAAGRDEMWSLIGDS